MFAESNRFDFVQCVAIGIGNSHNLQDEKSDHAGHIDGIRCVRATHQRQWIVSESKSGELFAMETSCNALRILDNDLDWFYCFNLQSLTMIVESLPLLTHLDISGTNLAGTGVAQFGAQEKVKSSDIPGLVSRANNPLQFLGLYNTAHSACRRHDIPALRVSILYAVMVWKRRSIRTNQWFLFVHRFRVMQMKSRF